MEGRLNCKLSADNAAHAKLRHLENKIDEIETNIDNVEQQVTELDNALNGHITQISEELDTNKVTANIIDAETVDAVTVLADDVNALDISATAIDVESIDVENLKATALQGTTASVEEVIATTGEFTETNIENANIENADIESLDAKNANLEGTTTIDGDIIFTKDNGLSKLEGNYLDIEASNITIENKNGDERAALLVKDVDSLVEFEGKLKVHNDVELENLTVNKEAFLSDAILNNPTFDNIADTQKVSTRCLDIDDNGKLVRLNIGEASDVVATALVASGDDNLERVNISADGAYFNEPVELNGETTIVSETVDTSNITNATITSLNATDATLGNTNIDTIEVETLNATNATIETAEATNLNATDAELDNITMNVLNGKKFYDGEWYDAIVSSETGDDFVNFIENTTLEYPKIYVTGPVNLENKEFTISDTVVSADIYGPKGNYQFRVDLRYKEMNKFHFHNMNVFLAGYPYNQYNGKFIGDEFVNLKFDSCAVRLGIGVSGEDNAIIKIYNLVDSTLGCLPPVVLTDKWDIILGDGCKNSFIEIEGASNLSIKTVEFGNAENCIIKALKVEETDFHISTNSEVMNTFIDKGGTLERIDISNSSAIYNGELYDGIIFTKDELYNEVKTATKHKKLLYLKLDSNIIINEVDITTDPGELNYNIDVHFAKINGIDISDINWTASSYFVKVLSHITWHNALVSFQTAKSTSTALNSLRLVDSTLGVVNNGVTGLSPNFEGLKNTLVNISTSNRGFSLDLKNCDKVKVIATDVTVFSYMYFIFTNNSFVNVTFRNFADDDVTNDSMWQLGCNSNIFQVGVEGNRRIIEGGKRVTEDY